MSKWLPFADLTINTHIYEPSTVFEQSHCWLRESWGTEINRTLHAFTSHVSQILKSNTLHMKYI